MLRLEMEAWPNASDKEQTSTRPYPRPPTVALRAVVLNMRCNE